MARPWVGRIDIPCPKCGKSRIFNDSPAGRRKAGAACPKCSDSGRKPQDPKERFERQWIPEPNSGCWLWLGSMFPKTGYGSFRINPKSLSTGAHRASWIIHRGEIAPGLQVCHRCDVRLCVNPDHLFLGTAFDNMQDAARKGRMNWKPDAPPRHFPRGEQHHMSPLTEANVREIRKSDDTGVNLARRFGITPTSLSRVRRGLVWRHVS